MKAWTQMEKFPNSYVRMAMISDLRNQTQKQMHCGWSETAPMVFSRYQRAEKEPFNVATDVCVPLDKVANIFKAHQADLDSRCLRVALLGHVGDRNVHSSSEPRDSFQHSCLTACSTVR